MNLRAAWLEYRTAAQFAKPWDTVEDVLAMRFVLSDKSPPPEAATVIHAERRGATFRWMEEVDPPAWFKRDEVGGSTMATPASNAERARRQLIEDAKLERAVRTRRARA